MEPWLAPDDPEVPPRKADLLKGLDQVLHLLETTLGDLPEEAIWWTPAPTVPPVGARLQHIAGASYRLAAYALEANPGAEALAAMARRDWTVTHRPRAELMAEVRRVFTRIREQVEGLAMEALDERRPVGRRQIPVRRSAILHHLVEHAAHHTGQVVLLVRLWEASGRPASPSEK